MFKVTLSGNVGSDVKEFTDKAGNKFVSFSVGVSTGTKANPETTWVTGSCGGKLAEVCSQFVKKGMKVLIEGRPHTNAYINKTNNAVAELKVYIGSIEFLSKVDADDKPELSSDIPF